MAASFGGDVTLNIIKLNAGTLTQQIISPGSDKEILSIRYFSTGVSSISFNLYAEDPAGLNAKPFLSGSRNPVGELVGEGLPSIVADGQKRLLPWGLGMGLWAELVWEGNDLNFMVSYLE